MHFLRYIALGFMSAAGVRGNEVTGTVNATEMQNAA